VREEKQKLEVRRISRQTEPILSIKYKAGAVANVPEPSGRSIWK